MNMGCQHIDRALKFLESEGNKALEVSKWTKVSKVIQMRDKLSVDLKVKIQSQIRELSYWETKETPHNPAGEGFLCKRDNVALAFPR